MKGEWKWKEILLFVLTLVSFICGASLMAIGMYVINNVSPMVSNNLDPVVKTSNVTWTLVARYSSIVPNKDYIPVEIDLGPWLTWLPMRIFDMGVIVMAFSAFGMYVVSSRKSLQLYILIGILLVTVVGQLVFMINMMDLRSELHRRLRGSLYNSLMSRYEFGAEAHDPFTFLMNGIMLMGECCGVNGPHDFAHGLHTFVHTGNNHKTHNATVLFPLACCQRSYIEQGFYKTLDCALSWSRKAINKQGCYETVYAYMSEQFGEAILWVYVIVSYVELMQVILALSLAKELRKKEQRTRQPGTIAWLRQYQALQDVENANKQNNSKPVVETDV